MPHLDSSCTSHALDSPWKRLDHIGSSSTRLNQANQLLTTTRQLTHASRSLHRTCLALWRITPCHKSCTAIFLAVRPKPPCHKAVRQKPQSHKAIRPFLDLAANILFHKRPYGHSPNRTAKTPCHKGRTAKIPCQNYLTAILYTVRPNHHTKNDRTAKPSKQKCYTIKASNQNGRTANSKTVRPSPLPKPVVRPSHLIITFLNPLFHMYKPFHLTNSTQNLS